MTTLADLITAESKQAIYNKAIQVATTLGLPVTSWGSGDPTRAMFWHLSEVLSTLEQIVVKYVAAGFLDYAAQLTSTFWLKLLAQQVYGYTPAEATHATCVVELSNTGGGVYTIDPGALTVKKGGTEITYHNVTSGTLVAGGTLSLDFVADVAGSDGSAAVGEVDTMVTTYLGVTCSNTTAAVGIDEESAASIVAGCRAKLGSLSPNGPADAYSYVVQASALTGTSAITRSRVVDDSTFGVVTVYVAGPDGLVNPSVVAAAQSAVETWATPLCITPLVVSATNVVVPVTYTLQIYDDVNATSQEIEDAVQASLADMFASRPIGGDSGGVLPKSLIESTILRTYPSHGFRVTVTAPAADVSLSTSQVAVLGAINATVVQEARP